MNIDVLYRRCIIMLKPLCPSGWGRFTTKMHWCTVRCQFVPSTFILKFIFKVKKNRRDMGKLNCWLCVSVLEEIISLCYALLHKVSFPCWHHLTHGVCVCVCIVRERKRGWGSDKGMSEWNEWKLSLPINKQLGPLPWGLHASLQMQLHKKRYIWISNCEWVRESVCMHMQLGAPSNKD